MSNFITIASNLARTSPPIICSIRSAADEDEEEDDEKKGQNTAAAGRQRKMTATTIDLTKEINSIEVIFDDKEVELDVYLEDCFALVSPPKYEWSSPSSRKEHFQPDPAHFRVSSSGPRVTNFKVTLLLLLNNNNKNIYQQQQLQQHLLYSDNPMYFESAIFIPNVLLLLLASCFATVILWLVWLLLVRGSRRNCVGNGSSSNKSKIKLLFRSIKTIFLSQQEVEVGVDSNSFSNILPSSSSSPPPSSSTHHASSSDSLPSPSLSFYVPTPAVSSSAPHSRTLPLTLPLPLVVALLSRVAIQEEIDYHIKSSSSSCSTPSTVSSTPTPPPDTTPPAAAMPAAAAAEAATSIRDRTGTDYRYKADAGLGNRERTGTGTGGKRISAAVHHVGEDEAKTTTTNGDDDDGGSDDCYCCEEETGATCTGISVGRGVGTGAPCAAATCTGCSTRTTKASGGGTAPSEAKDSTRTRTDTSPRASTSIIVRSPSQRGMLDWLESEQTIQVSKLKNIHYFLLCCCYCWLIRSTKT